MADTQTDTVVDATAERMYRRDEVLIMLEARRLWHSRPHPVQPSATRQPPVLARRA